MKERCAATVQGMTISLPNKLKREAISFGTILAKSVLFKNLYYEALGDNFSLVDKKQVPY